MLNFPEINPTLIKLGFLEIRWYGLLYIISFILGFIFLKKIFKLKKIEISKQQYENLIFNIMLGVIIGGRLGYVIFYKLSYYLANPLKILAVWEGGMSFHGGAIGVIIIGFLFCRKNKFNFYKLADPVMPLVAVGLGLGRIGNFINAELYGRVSDVPWAMIFPTDPEKFARHPSQLYEAFFEGFLLAIILYLILVRTRKNGLVFWTFIGLYGFFRFFIEFTRQPDEHLGFLIGFMTMGQILCSIMIITAIVAIYLLIFRKDGNNQI